MTEAEMTTRTVRRSKGWLRTALLGCVTGAGLFAAGVTPAAANFILGDVTNTKIYFNPGSGNTFTGNVDTNNTGPLVNFTADNPVNADNGFGTIKPVKDGIFMWRTVGAAE